jgi:hypothetical protein
MGQHSDVETGESEWVHWQDWKGVNDWGRTDEWGNQVSEDPSVWSSVRDSGGPLGPIPAIPADDVSEDRELGGKRDDLLSALHGSRADAGTASRKDDGQRPGTGKNSSFWDSKQLQEEWENLLQELALPECLRNDCAEGHDSMYSSFENGMATDDGSGTGAAGRIECALQARERARLKRERDARMYEELVREMTGDDGDETFKSDSSDEVAFWGFQTPGIRTAEEADAGSTATPDALFRSLKRLAHYIPWLFSDENPDDPPHGDAKFWSPARVTEGLRRLREEAMRKGSPIVRELLFNRARRAKRLHLLAAKGHGFVASPDIERLPQRLRRKALVTLNPRP